MAKFAMIKGGYKNLIVPMNMLEKVVGNCYLGTTNYTEDGEQLTELCNLSDFTIIDEVDLADCETQMALEGKNGFRK
jgi:hypothetical protein